MIDKMTGGAMSMTVTTLMAALADQTELLRQIAAQLAPAPASHPDAAPQRYVLSSGNPNARWLTPGMVTIIGILPGGDIAGRGVLQFGSDSAQSLPIWLAAGVSQLIDLTAMRIELTPGIEVSWVPAGGTTWDVTIFYRLREPQGRRAK